MSLGEIPQAYCKHPFWWHNMPRPRRSNGGQQKYHWKTGRFWCQLSKQWMTQSLMAWCTFEWLREVMAYVSLNIYCVGRKTAVSLTWQSQIDPLSSPEKGWPRINFLPKADCRVKTEAMLEKQSCLRFTMVNHWPASWKPHIMQFECTTVESRNTLNSFAEENIRFLKSKLKLL